MHPEIHTELGNLHFAPGERLKGHVNYTNTASAELRLFYYTEGKGTQDIEVIQTLPFQTPGAFEFQLPVGPYSFSGTLISLSWALELIVNPGDQLARLEFVVSPTAEEIDLTRYPVSDDLKKSLKNKFSIGRS
jgi:hypothetical protein